MKPETRLKKDKERLSEWLACCKQSADSRLAWAIETMNTTDGDKAFSILSKIERRVQRVFDAVEDLEDLLSDLEDANGSDTEVRS